jgi:hypothetical protein
LSDIIRGRTPADGEKVLKITRQDLYLKSFCTQSRGQALDARERPYHLTSLNRRAASCAFCRELKAETRK